MQLHSNKPSDPRPAQAASPLAALSYLSGMFRRPSAPDLAPPTHFSHPAAYVGAVMAAHLTAPAREARGFDITLNLGFPGDAARAKTCLAEALGTDVRTLGEEPHRLRLAAVPDSSGARVHFSRHEYVGEPALQLSSADARLLQRLCGEDVLQRAACAGEELRGQYRWELKLEGLRLAEWDHMQGLAAKLILLGGTGIYQPSHFAPPEMHAEVDVRVERGMRGLVRNILVLNEQYRGLVNAYFRRRIGDAPEREELGRLIRDELGSKSGASFGAVNRLLHFKGGEPPYYAQTVLSAGDAISLYPFCCGAGYKPCMRLNAYLSAAQPLAELRTAVKFALAFAEQARTGGPL